MTIQIRKNNSLLLSLLFVIIYFTPNFRFLPYYTWAIALLGFLICFSGNNAWKIGILDRKNRNFMGLLLISIGFVLIIPVIHGTNDFSYINLFMGVLLCMFRNFLIVFLIRNKRMENTDYTIRFIDLYLNSCCICVAFTLLFIVFPGFKLFWMNKVILNDVLEQIRIYSAYEFRYSISGFAAFSYSTLFSIAIIMEGYTICKKNFSAKEIIRYIIICIGCFFYGRVTIFAIAISMFMVITKGRDIAKTIRYLLIVVLGFFFLAILLDRLSQIDQSFAVWQNWAFSFLDDIIIDGSIQTHSVTHMLQDMYFMPELDTFILGDGYYTDPFTGRYYMSTDVGYMRLLLYSGIVGIIIVFFPVIYFFYSLYKQKNDKDFKRFVIALLCSWVILEAKGESWMRFILLLHPVLLILLTEKKDGKTDKRCNESV